MLLCVTLCPLINCPKTVKILALKGLKKNKKKNDIKIKIQFFDIQKASCELFSNRQVKLVITPLYKRRKNYAKIKNTSYKPK